MALVGIRTAIEAMQQKFIESFSSMGATGFTIRYVDRNFGFNRQEVKKEKKGNKRKKKSNFEKPITKLQGRDFQK